MAANERFKEVINIIYDMADAKEISSSELIIICKYGAKGQNPNDTEDSTEKEREIWNRIMFLMERHCRERGLISLDNQDRQPCEIWTRVMGYCRPVSEFNQGKKSEFYERKYFCEEKIPNSKEISNEFNR